MLPDLGEKKCGYSSGTELGKPRSPLGLSGNCVEEADVKRLVLVF
jgi:hypothetical protein